MADRTPPPRDVHVLLNPGAKQGRDAALVEHAYAPWRERGFVVRIVACSQGHELAACAQDAVRQRASVVVAAGGDGTVSAVASALVSGEVPLGILPLGTLNHFAVDAGVPLSLDEAVAVTCEGIVRRVDVGVANGRTFLNTLNLGVYFDIVRARERWQGRIGKWPAALVAFAMVLRNPPILKLDIDADGRRIRSRVPVLFAGNNEHALKWPELGHRARLDAGILRLVLVHEAGRWALVRQMANVLLGRSHLADHLEVLSAREVQIHSRLRHLRVALDGERLVLRAPLRLSVEPGALPVLVPAPAITGPPS